MALRKLKGKAVDSPPQAFACDTPARSKAHRKVGAQGEATVRTIALDLGSRITYCEVSDGEVKKRTSAESLDGLRGLLGPQTPKAQVAVEACREAWHVMDQLREWGHSPVLVDTTRVRQVGVGQHKRKNDRIDAEALARALAEGRLPKAHELSKHRQKLRRAVNARALLVRMRSQLVTAIRGEARAAGEALKPCAPENFVENFSKANVSAQLQQQVAPLVKVLETLEPQVAKADEYLAAVSSMEPAVQLLQTAPGVGPILAASMVSVVDDPKRFDTAHEVESYLGLVPSENTSVKRRLGSITKQGNSYLRAVLIQASWTILRSRRSNPLKTWAKKVQERRGKRVAVVALARRLAGVLWAMWYENAAFDPGKVRSAPPLDGTGKGDAR